MYIKQNMESASKYFFHFFVLAVCERDPKHQSIKVSTQKNVR